MITTLNSGNLETLEILEIWKSGNLEKVGFWKFWKFWKWDGLIILAKGIKMPNTQDTHELLTDSILDLIELHQNVAPHLVAHALISTGARLARDAAPTPKDAEELIEIALEIS